MKSDISRLCLMLAAGAALTGCNDGGSPAGSGGVPAPVTYSLSGTVSGLVGTGLVLGNNGTAVPVAANGTVSLGNAFSAGSSYAVTVTTQPTGPAQVCSVTQGSGVVSGNVSNITVTCATTPMTVISSTPADSATQVARNVLPVMTMSVPLNASSVAGHVSLRRGTHTVAANVSTSGATVTLAPLRPLSLLTRYTVAADTGLLGTFGETPTAAIARSFTTLEGTWQSIDVVQPTAPSAGNAVVALTSDGSAVATWTENNSGSSNIWASVHAPGQAWSTAVQLDTTSAGDATSPAVATDGNGEAVVVWQQFDGSRWEIFAARHTSAGWGTAFQVSPTGIGSGNEQPQLAVNPDGDVVFVWVNTASQDGSVWARLQPTGGTLGSAARIDTAIGNASYPKAVIDPSGNATVVWINAGAGSAHLWGNRFSGGTWSTSVPIDTATGSLSEHSLSLDNQGGAIAAWSQQAGNSSQDINTSRFAQASGWSSPTTIASTSNGSSYYPAVAADVDGNVMIQWGQFDGSQFRQYYSYRPTGSNWSAPAPMGAGATAIFAFDASGNALALWYEEAGGNGTVKSARFVAPGTWSQPVTVAAGRAESQPQLAIDTFGKAMAVWANLDTGSGTTRVVGSRFDDTP